MSDTKNTLASKKRFQAQCFLTDYWQVFSAANSSRAYKNFIIVDGDGTFLMNRLTGSRNLALLSNLTPYQVAALVPKIRLYKVYPKLGNDYVSIEKTEEFIFPENLAIDDINRITESHSGKNTGYGIKSFNFEFAGKNEAETFSNIKAELSIRLQTMEELLGGLEVADERAKLIDLILPAQKYKLNQYVFSPEYFRIKAVVGWATLKAGELFTSEEVNAIADCTLTLDLSLIDHDFSFNQDGSIDMKVTYQAWIEALTGAANPDSNVLASSEKEAIIENDLQNKENQTKKIDDIDECLKKDKYAGNSHLNSAKEQAEKDLEDIKKKDIDRLQKVNLYGNFLSKLTKNSLIRWVSIPSEDIGAWTDSWFEEGQTRQKTQPTRDSTRWQSQLTSLSNLNRRSDIEKKFEDLTEAKSDSKEMIENAEEVTNDQFVAELDGNNVIINYVYFGDILNLALDRLVKADPKFKVICGPIVFREPRTPANSQDMKIVNLADVPISLDLFIAWFTNNVIKPQKYSYPLDQFLKDVLTEVVEPALTSTCFAETATINMTVAMETFNLAAESTQGIFKGYRYPVTELVPFVNSALGIHDDKYLVLYSRKFLENRKAEEFKDVSDKIAYFKLGTDRGLVKKIEFNKEDMQYNRESRISQAYQSGVGQLARLRGKYNATITLHGNALFYPGQLVFVDPVMMGMGSVAARGKVASLIGLGGYYRVIKVESSIERGKFETVLQTKWEAMGDGSGLAPETVALADKCQKIVNQSIQSQQERKNIVRLTDQQMGEAATPF